MTLQNKLLAILDSEGIQMKDKETTIKKLIELHEDGVNKLQVITDFDRTVSKHHHNGKTTKSSYCVFETVPTLPQSFLEGCTKLVNKYRVIEDNPSMTIEEKIPYMEEWWELNEKLLIGLPYYPDQIKEAVANSGVMLRDKADMCFKKLNEKGIPVLVLSAGLGHIVVEILQYYNVLFDNMKVISNFFKIENGKILGFVDKPLHIFNKNEHAIENSDYFQVVKTRTNVIVMGDSLGDANMAEGVPPGGIILKIGYLSVNIDEYLPQYLEHFDIVLIDDQTMDVLNDILSLIL